LPVNHRLALPQACGELGLWQEEVSGSSILAHSGVLEPAGSWRNGSSHKQSHWTQGRRARGSR